MRRVVQASLLLLTIGLAGCSASGPLDPGERRALDRARDRWNAHRPAEYTFEVRESCFCGVEANTWIEVHVRGDSVLAVTSLEALPPGASLTPSAWPTVERLFGIVEGSSHSESIEDVEVTYDSDYGYPRTIDLTCPKDYLDCGALYMARNLRPVPIYNGS